jgi:hypothetical protein
MSTCFRDTTLGEPGENHDLIVHMGTLWNGVRQEPDRVNGHHAAHFTPWLA